MRKESSTNFENEQTLTDFCNAFKTLQLKQLTHDLLVVKETRGTSVTYILTVKGITLKNILADLAAWQETKKAP